jgi:hypothetical protein
MGSLRVSLVAATVALASWQALAAAGPLGGGRYPYQADKSNEQAPQRTITFVGDSLTDQAAGAIRALGEQRRDTIDVWAKPGAAACDFVKLYAAHLDAKQPSEVSFGFVGNAQTPCMTGGGPPRGVLSQQQQNAVASAYYRDLSAMIAMNAARGIRSWVVMPPAMARGTFHGQVTDELAARFAQLASTQPLTYLDTGPRDLLTPRGTFRPTLRFGGHDHPIRSRDGIHLGLPYGTTLYAEAVLATTAQEPR